MIALAEAQQRLLAMATAVEGAQLPLSGCTGHYAAEAITALRSQPDAPLSAMDGYAVAAASLPGPWTLVGESAAGHRFTGPVPPGSAVRISTGAIVPDDCHCVIMQEETRREDAAVHWTGAGPIAPGHHIRAAGMDFRAGDMLIAPGSKLTPPRIALAAMAGHAVLPIRRRLRIAVLDCGDELVPPGTTPATGQIPATNALMLTAMLASLPADTAQPLILPDRLDALTAHFRSLIDSDAPPDIIVTTGGASVGDHDLIRPALHAMGATLDFWRVAMKPGKPIMAAKLSATLVLGLPGNPVSAYVTALLLLLPLVRHMAGASDPWPTVRLAVLGSALPATGPRQEFVRGLFDGDARVVPVAMQDSGALSGLAAADCLIVRAADAPSAASGTTVETIPVPR